MLVCDVCFDHKGVVGCFGDCTLSVCVECFNKILKQNIVGDIEYCCPQCRITSIKNKDNEFTDFINSNPSTLRTIVDLLEEQCNRLHVVNLMTQWHAWSDASRNLIQFS